MENSASANESSGGAKENSGEKKVGSALVWSSIALLAIIVFGLLWFFLIAPASPSGNAGWFLFSFAAGLTMIVLPCTLPLAFVIVPLSMGKGVAKGIGMALAFGIGVAITLSLYGVAAALIGKAAIGSLGAPLETVKNWVYFIAGIFAYLFALGSIGLLKFKMPTYTGAAPKVIQEKQDYLKALLMGLFLGNIGVGCPHPATPLLLIEIASSGNVLYGWLLFLVHAIGRVLPLLLLAFMGIIGVNGLSWLVARREKVEKATGWAMVFVAGFIMTLGLFTHDWWVNSGQHTLLEGITQEEKFLNVIGENLGTGNVHHHGLEDGTGLFGLPLGLGNWFLVFLWALPFWWWYKKEQARVAAISDANQTSEKQEEMKLLRTKRSFYIALVLVLALIFIYILPTRFYQQTMSGGGHDMSSMMGTGTTAPAFQNKFSESTDGLSEALPSSVVTLRDGEAYDLVAKPVWKEIRGKKVRMFGYNGMIPGPTIKVAQGSEVTIRLKNETEVDTTLHSHGVRLNYLFDGVADLQQKPIKPGETFEYTVKFSDAGIFWYHPHIREDYTQELGLYGNYIVAPANPAYWSPVDNEMTLFLDDIALDDSGSHPFYQEGVNNALMGRFGNIFLLDGNDSGKYMPMAARTGETTRIYFTNSSNVRTMNISIPGAKMKLVATDQGKYEEEKFVEDFLISPGERMVVEAMFGSEGNYPILHTTPTRSYNLGVFEVTGEAPLKDTLVFVGKDLRVNDLGVSGPELRKYLAAAPDKRLRFTIEMAAGAMDHGSAGHDNSDGHHGLNIIPQALANGGGHKTATEPAGEVQKIEWEDNPEHMNAMMTDKNTVWKIVDEATGLENMDIDWAFKEGDMVKVNVFNDPASMHPMQHPIHFHGQRFLVLATNGVPNDNLAWKDTALVQAGDTVDFLVEMGNPGIWMAHCHIAEHLHAGMMFAFTVGDYQVPANFRPGKAPGPITAANIHTHADGTAHTHTETGTMTDGMTPAADGHLHDDGTMHQHTGAAPTGGTKALLIIASLALMAALSWKVKKYLEGE